MNTTKTITNAIKDASKAKTKGYDTTATVKRVEGSTVWVHIPGGVDETPVKRTINAKIGDTVQVRVSDGSAWIVGNTSAPPTDDARANYIGELATPSIDFVQELTDKDVTVKSISAATGYIGELTADHITTGDIQASTGYIKELQADNITAEDIAADHATIDDLDANFAHITNGVIDNAKIGYADVNDLEAHYARVTNGVIDNATINHADVNDLDVDYVQADLANIDQAIVNTEWVDTILVQSGLIAHDATTFELDAIQVNASKITAGTIDVSRIVVTDPVTGDKHMVTWDETTQTWVAAKLDGDVLKDLTITADKIVAEAITADKITTQNLIGSGGWINLRNGTFAYADAGENNYLKWNGSKLQIKADEFILSTGQNILDAIEAINTYFLAGVPTTENEPAVDWTTDNLKRQHLRDVYYDTDSGKSYRWSLSTEEALQDENGETLQDDNDYDLIGQFENTRYAWIQISDGDLDEISDRVSVAETKIAQNQTDIQTKASQTDLDLATTRLTQAETTIAQNSQAIALKAEASSVYSKLEIDGKFHEGLNIRTTFGDTSITLTATVVLAGVDVTNDYMPGDFEWFYRLPDGDEFVNDDRTTSYGKSMTLQKSGMKYGQSIICVFTKRAEDSLTDDDGEELQDENGDTLIGYLEVA